MRKLHLVGVTSDLKGLIFSGRRGSRSGGYLVNIEDELIDAIADARRGTDGHDVGRVKAALGAGGNEEPKKNRPESILTPREMQARLRAGRSIAEVAVEARVDAEWVERFAVPILAEQAKVVDLARSLRISKARLGESAAPLGKSLALNLAERGVMMPPDMFDAGWSAHQLHDSVWVVRFRYRSRGRLQEASWAIDTENGIASHRNRLGSELGYVEGARRRKASNPADDGPDQPSPSRPRPTGADSRSASRSPQPRTRAGARRVSSSPKRSTGRPGARPRPRPARAGTAARSNSPAGPSASTTGPNTAGKARSKETSSPRRSAATTQGGTKSSGRPAKAPAGVMAATNRVGRANAAAKGPVPGAQTRVRAAKPLPPKPSTSTSRGPAPLARQSPPAKSRTPAGTAAAAGARARPPTPPTPSPRDRRPVISAQPVSQLVKAAGPDGAPGPRPDSTGGHDRPNGGRSRVRPVSTPVQAWPAPAG